MSDEALRVVFTIPNFITAGSGQVLVNIISRLDRTRFSPTVCISRKGGRLDQVVEDLGVPLLEAPFTVAPKPYATLLARARQAARIFRPYKFAFWHSFHYSDDYSEPLIARLSGARAWVYTKKNMGWGSRAWVLRSLLASRIVVDNSEMPDLFFSGYRLRKKVRLIPHGVPLDRFAPRSEKTGVYHARYGIPPDAPLIACVAHLVPVKGVPTLIQAVAQVEKAHLLLAGRPADAAYATHLQQQVSEHGLQERVHFLDHVSDIPGLLAEVDVAVLPTRLPGEGCPVALLEAMACAKACIATDIPGSRDLIIHQESGLLVPPEDPGALAGALRRLAGDPDLRRRYGESARKRVERHFTIEREVAAHEALYSELLKI